MDRKSGIIMHISSLPGEYSCGNFGKSAFEFIDFLKESGFSYWQVLPFGITDAHFSPYMSFSSFGGNLYFIDPEALFEEGLVSEKELSAEKNASVYLCDFERLEKSRFAFLERASERFSDFEKLEKFYAENPMISDFCLFMAKKSANGGKCHSEWKNDNYSEKEFAAWRFIEYKFHEQWQKLHAYANEKGIEIIGDIPFYVSYDSQDVLTFGNDFMLDEKKHPKKVAGVPPDYFSENGQKWGNPLYDWDAMEKNDFSYWKARLGYVFDIFDGVRIDHFRAFSDFWAVPADAETAKEGEWLRGPGRKMIDVIKRSANGKKVIAENLGIIDDSVNELLSYSGFPGMSVFQFGFDGNYSNPHLPHNYTPNTVAFTGTHDNNTLLGFMWECDEKTRAAVLDYIGFSGDDWNKCYDTIIRELLRSGAETVIFPIQDILGFGGDTRLNTPGRADGNWRFRVTSEQLSSIDKKRFRHLNEIYSRI